MGDHGYTETLAVNHLGMSIIDINAMSSLDYEEIEEERNKMDFKTFLMERLGSEAENYHGSSSICVESQNHSPVHWSQDMQKRYPGNEPVVEETEVAEWYSVNPYDNRTR